MPRARGRARRRAGRAGPSSCSGSRWARRRRARCCSTIFLIRCPDVRVRRCVPGSGQRARTASRAGVSPAKSSKVRRTVFGACERLGEHERDVVARHRAAPAERGRDVDRPLPGSSWRLAGAHDRPVERARSHPRVGLRLRPQVGPHRLRPAVGILRADRGDDHEARDAERLGRLDALHRRRRGRPSACAPPRCRDPRRRRTRWRRRRRRAGGRRRARGRRARRRRRRPRCRRRGRGCGSGRGPCDRRAPAGG